jgi:citrate lyase subunit beta/citryl-CoA lyase
VDDPAQAGRDARRARDEFGFLRMWPIHPAQIEPILEAFAPDADAVARAAGRELPAPAIDRSFAPPDG